MAEILGYQFDRVFAEPIELYRKVDTISERDAIPTGKRYQGMLCYVVSENEDYQLRSGTTNGDWIASGIGNFFNKSTDDTDDITEGATNLFMTTTEQTKLGHITVTQAIDLDQLETDVAALSGGVLFKGVWSPSGGVFPGGGASIIGDLYIADDIGTIDGISFVSGDGIISTVANASTTVYASNWAKTESTSDVTSVVGLNGVITKTALLSALNVEDGATADMTDAEIVAAINNELTVTTWQNPLTKEQVLDYIGEAIAAGTQTNITVTYNDVSDSIDFDVAPNFDAATLSGLDSTQFLRSDIADTKTAGDLTLADNVKIQLGTAGAESEISSDGVDTILNLKNGDLNIQNNGVDIVAVERATSKVGLGTTDLYGALTINTGLTDVTYDLSNQTIGTMAFNNGASGQPSPVITSKSSSNSALRIITASTDAVNSYPDFNISVRTLTAGDFSALTGTAFLLTRFNASLLRILRNGNTTFSGAITSTSTGTNTFSGDVIVPSDPYTSDWNGDNSAPTKNDVYDEMETKATESSGSFLPTIAPATSGSYTYTRLNCNYTKVGKLIFVTIGFNFSASSSPVGAVEITLNLPGSPTTTGRQYLNIGEFSNFSPTQPAYSQMTPTVFGGKVTFTDYEGVTVDDMDLSFAVITMSGVIAID